jgi:hypothetical protein
MRLWALPGTSPNGAAPIEARQAAEVANQTKDHFLAVLSHDLHAPLEVRCMLIAVATLEHGQSPDPMESTRFAFVGSSKAVRRAEAAERDFADLSNPCSKSQVSP